MPSKDARPRKGAADQVVPEYDADRPDPPRTGAGGVRERRRAPWWVKMLAFFTGLLLLFFAVTRLDLVPGLDDVFGSETKDRTGPAVLKSIRDMSSYQAASGNFQVVVDLEKDTKYVPDAIKGTRTLFVGAGTVGASVDLGGIGDDAVTVNEERTRAEIRLPHAKLGKPALDADRSYTVSKQRGLLDRLGDFISDNPGSEQAVNKLAVQHIGDAAKESGLVARAERNTTGMLEGLLTSLGFEEVTVVYGDK
ncbi:DUF4230 domain-containing protein [Streptomyces koyangensis]|uniref:DUF4230 domain-containing protein n=1 Tax=Streptomyces koyangensis TaxID=188770 RepID=A0ABX7E9N7_9ACTN|nr:DUF4230 domain-containing protein [Streptomyces koyangensis]QRF01102.1 DUF4230 domain-containing protein [Streptomyces koyangensis]